MNERIVKVVECVKNFRKGVFWGILGGLSFFLPGNLPAQADPAEYLEGIKTELKKEWPANRTINLVFHGHSVPAGYFKTPEVNTLLSYPQLLLAELKTLYPCAVINVIITAIGGENSEAGAERFAEDVLTHKPDVLFIDYALNDIGLGLARARKAWETMITAAQAKGIRVILLTPSPDQSMDILTPGNDMELITAQIRRLAREYGTGIADSYEAFRVVYSSGSPLSQYMSQVNHPNYQGHYLIMKEILPYFK